MKLAFIFAGALGLLLCGCQGYRYQDDNILEELSEEALRVKTGAEVDFSGKTPEKGFSPSSLKPFVKEEASATEGK